jgi:cyclomaltodextrinase
MTKEDILYMPPEWASKVIWYQILVERFRNGNPGNDPSRESIEGATVDKVPENWSITPWGHNWYKKEDWAEQMPVDFYRTVQLRRYGGDLTGVLEKIPYLKKLGINAIYFNPLNQAPSLHKYDPSYYHHVDVHFGPSPIEDLRQIKEENPGDPLTWTWTNADQLFLHLITVCHDHDIKVIVDFSWNHTGHTFWAFEDIKKNHKNSAFLDWYEKIDFAEDKIEKSFTYSSWNQISTLPEIKKLNSKRHPEYGYLEGDLPENVKNHIFAVCQRWIDPKNNGDHYYGIDGMRLDVADLVPMSFWRELRHKTKEMNSAFFLVGENWWEEWPHKLLDPRPWLEGDTFDSVMHYQWFQCARSYFGDSADNVNLLGFIGKMQEIYSGIRVENCRTLMNLVSSHDAPRLLTTLQNNNHYKFHCKPQEDPDYLTYYPNTITYTRAALLLIHQFTFLGSPHIWNGDEIGMTGADDPDNRKPLHWPDIIFEKETASEFSTYTYEDNPYMNAGVFDLYQKLIKLRKKHESLNLGDCIFYTDDIDTLPLLIYTRSWRKEKIVVLFNNNDVPYPIPTKFAEGKPLFQYNITHSFGTHLPAYSAIVKCLPSTS